MSSEDIKSLGRQLRQIEDPHTRRLFERILENQDTIKESLAALENPVLDGWRDLETKNGWVRYTGDTHNPPQFTKEANGIVRVRGLVSSGTTTPGTVIATLPVGYRPEYISIFPGETSPSAHARVDVNPNGDIIIRAGNNTYFVLDQIHFVAAR